MASSSGTPTLDFASFYSAERIALWQQGCVRIRFFFEIGLRGLHLPLVFDIIVVDSVIAMHAMMREKRLIGQSKSNGLE